MSAARLDPDPRAAEVLQAALIAARERAVLRSPRPVFQVAYSSDGKLALAASTRGVAVYDAGKYAPIIVLRGDAPTTDATFAGDRLVLVGESNGEAQLRDARSGRVLATLAGRSAVTTVAAEHGGGLLVVGHERGPIQIADGSGHVVGRVKEPGTTSLVVIAPGGRLVAAVARDRRGDERASLFTAADGKVLKVFPTPNASAVGFNPDGSVLAVAGSDGKTTLWDTRSGRRIGLPLDDGKDGITDVAFSPDGRLIATSSDDGGVRVWLVSSGRRLDFFTGHTGHSLTVAWSPDGRLVADGSSDETAKIWAVRGLVERGELVTTLAGHTGAVTAVAFRPGASQVLTGSRDGTARVWDGHPEEVLRLLGRHAGPVTSASFSPDGRRVVSAGSDRTARIWDVASGRLVRTLPHTAPVVSAAFGDDGREILTAAGHTARLWTSVGRLSWVFPVASLIRVAQLSQDGRWVLLAFDHVVELRDATTSRLVTRQPLRGRVVTAALAPDGTRIAAADSQGDVRVWSSGGDRVWGLQSGGCSTVAFSPDGGTLGGACGSEGHLWDAGSGRLLHVLRGPGPSKPLTTLVFSPDGRSTLTTDVTGSANTWDTRTGVLLQALVGQFGRIASAAFSPDGRWILTGGPIAAILWSANSGKLVFYLRGHRSLVTSVSFGPDSRHVLTSSLDGTVRTYVCQVCGSLPELERLAETRLAAATR